MFLMLNLSVKNINLKKFYLSIDLTELSVNSRSFKPKPQTQILYACLTNLYATWRFLKRLSEDEKYKEVVNIWGLALRVLSCEVCPKFPCLKCLVCAIWPEMPRFSKENLPEKLFKGKFP